MRIFRWLCIIALMLVGIVFSALNAQRVEMNYLLGSTELPLAALLFIAALFGVVLTVLFMGIGLIKLIAKNKYLKRQLKQGQ